MLHSFGLRFKPWSDYAQTIRSEIGQRWHAAIDFVDHSLVNARQDDETSEAAFVEYLRTLYVSRPVDLIVAIGAPAAAFIQRHRQRLFPKTPMIFTAVEHPNHSPNPLLEENSREIRARVVAEKADLGIAWDGDADRCFFIDAEGEFVPGDFVTALLAEALLLKNPGAKILYDLRASRAVPDVITANGGVPLLNRVGHAFFKQRMRREGGLFGGEVSGHYYFADNYNADSGFIPALLILELLSQKKATMAELLEPLRTKYFISGEINSVVDDAPAALARIEERFADGEQGHLDGISGGLRPTGTSTCGRPTPSRCCASTSAPTLQALMEEKRDLVLSVILEG